ncbi:GumC family protein [Falsiroseomonas oryzae]|uniref:GumC family protein n=1 Tax=Falsiroseomonas oryzae TaxID=2766473 RepID=UPI0022EAE9DB|nr:exopolysaccharide transport family protein [Roseomonas sp. MO-31]
MDRLTFDAPFSPGLAELPVRMQAERAVSGMLLALWRYIHFLVLAIVVCLAIGVVVLASIEKRYQAEAVVQLDFSAQSIASGVQERSRGVLVEAGPMIQSEARIIRSRPMARQVVETLGLADDPAYADAPPALVYRIGAAAEAVGRMLRPTSVPETPAREPSAAEQRQDRIARAVDQVLMRLSVTNDNRSYLISIIYAAPDPVQAARIANAFAEEYLRRRQQDGADAASRVSEWLASRVRNTTAALRQAEAEIDAFRTETGLLEPGRPDGNGDSENVPQQRLRALSQQLNAATLARINEERRLARVQDLIAAGTIPSASDVPGLPLFSLLLDRESTARRELSEASARFGSRHPDVRQAQAGLAEIRGRLQAEVARAVTIISGELATARRLEEDLQRRLDAQQVAMVAGKQRETELRNMLANAQSLRDRLGVLVQNSETAAAAAQRASSVASLVAAADPPRGPEAPKPLVVMALALLAGLSAGTGIAVLLDRRDSGLLTGDDVRRALDTRCLGMLPDRPSRTAPAPERAAFDEAVYAICASTHLFGPSRECRVVLVTSSVPGEGKSMLCREMARTLTEAGKRVMFIGNATATDLAGAEPAGASPAETVPGLAVSASRLVVLDRRRSFRQRADINGQGGFGTLIEDARRHFDVIILEGEPVMLVADSLVLGHVADNIVHVTRWASTKRRIVAAALRRMQEHAVQPDGVVLTRVDLRRHAHLRVLDQCSFYTQQPRFFERLLLRDEAAAAAPARDSPR